MTAPAFIDRRPSHPPAGSQIHVPGWSSSMYTIDAGQHLVYDAEIVDGLVHAWKARKALDLPDETARMIADRIHRVAHTHFWRWPTIRLNQVNWYALVYAADATVTGSSALLRRDMRAQLVRFVSGPRNFGPGLRFQYLPQFGSYARAERRLGRVREHRPLVPALLQPGPASGDGAAAARRPRARPALDPPRDRGLLDARAAT